MGKLIKSVNELYRGTYFSAANKMDRKFPKKASQIRHHGSDKGIYQNFFIPDYKFDIYVGFALDNDSDGDANYEIYPKRVIKDLKIEDYILRMDTNKIELQIDVPKSVGNWYLGISIEFTEKGVNIVIFDDINSFANRRSVVQFMKLIHKLYVFHDPNVMRNVSDKINGTKTSELTYEDISEDNLWGFFQENGYDWNRFKNEININDLWREYD